MHGIRREETCQEYPPGLGYYVIGVLAGRLYINAANNRINRDDAHLRHVLRAERKPTLPPRRVALGIRNWGFDSRSGSGSTV